MNFTFGTPYFLLLLFFIPCFVWCKLPSKLYYFPKIAWIERETPLFAWELWLKVLIFSSLVLALAKPLVYDTKSNQHRKGRDLVLAIDASGSMAQSGFNETDRFKNKFETNIELATDFIAKRFDDNMGIVLFGTFAYTASPLTYDLKSLSHMLRLTNVGLAGESTAIGEAIMQSIKTLSFGEAKNKVIILLSDGYHNAGKTSPKQAVQKAKALGIKIYTIGIGKKSDYDVALLETMAKETGAKSYHASSASALLNIYQKIDELEPSSIRSEGYLHETLLILYPLIFAFILLLVWTIVDKENNNKNIIYKIHLIILFLLIIAMFRPSIAEEELEGKVEGRDIIIAIDVSFSMSATDISPSRYVFAKETIRYFLEQNPHSNIMLIGFTTNPLLLSPPTTDHRLVLVALDSLEPKNILTKGTSLKRVFEKIVSIDRESGGGHREMILITDGGEEHDMAMLSKLLTPTDISLHILAMGTESGSTLPTHDEGFLKDEQGNLVISRLNPLLKSLAQNMDGSYITSKESPKETAKLLTGSLARETNEIEKKEHKRLELYFIPLSLAIILFMMLHTRGRRYFQK